MDRLLVAFVVVSLAALKQSPLPTHRAPYQDLKTPEVTPNISQIGRFDRCE